jgi:hypothetical protein
MAHQAVDGLLKSGAEQSANISGSTDALRGIRGEFEAALHPLARAAFRCLKNLDREEDAGKVNLAPSDLHTARAVGLAALGETVLELAEPLTKPAATSQPAPGEKYGLTADAVSKVDDLWSRYSTAVGAPGSARAKRKAMTGALPGQFASAEEVFAELDDLVLQFRGSEEGNRFVDAWFNARRVSDTGRRAAKANHTPTPAPAPAHA